jgi:hypothetical protein
LGASFARGDIPANSDAPAISTSEGGEGNDVLKSLRPLLSLRDHDLLLRPPPAAPPPPTTAATTTKQHAFACSQHATVVAAGGTGAVCDRTSGGLIAPLPPSAPTAPTAPRRQAADEEILVARERLFEAQHYFPHDAGVFVGNLSVRLTDLQLLHEVKRAFRRYGACEVMVNRNTVINGQGKPWAIVQFQVSLFAHSLAHSNRD